MSQWQWPQREAQDPPAQPTQELTAGAFCSACGVQGGGDFCANCGKPRALPRGSSDDYAVAQMRAIGERLKTERHGVPALLSFFIPGLGQMVKGQFLTGVIVLAAAIAFGALCLVGIGLVMLPLLWIVQLYDAYMKPDAALAAEAKNLARRHRPSGR